MSKTQKSHKSQNIQKKNNIELNSDTDNEIELKPFSENNYHELKTITTKPKRNLSEQHKEQLRERLANARIKKAEQKVELNKIKSEFLKAKEYELNEKVLNNVKKIKQKQEKEYMKQLMLHENENNKYNKIKVKPKQKPVVILEEDSSSVSELSDEEPIVIKKKSVKKPVVKKNNHPPPDEPVIVQPQNYYQRPLFSIH